ncbi:MAG: Rpn family recombination-promoting nuclease/putative transposase [Treponema sp.]|nr:Rpn family recombination-promoting nuclease/putative transposase [Treponema sp.]
MRDPKICKGVIERLLQIKIVHIEYPELQKAISPFYSKKGVRLDVYVADSNRVFDVEFQSYDISNIRKRTRYYQSMIDIDSLMKGADYSELKESYVIYLCLNDPFKAGLPVYSFTRTCTENKDVSLGDQTHHVIYNCSAADKEENPDLKEFLEFVKSNKAESDFTKEIANMVQTKKFEQLFVNEYLVQQLIID